jgi:hypothetical protein
MKTNLVLISTMNMVARMEQDHARGRFHRSTVKQMCAHVKLWERFKYGAEPTPAEAEQARLNERLAALESAPKVPARFKLHPVIGLMYV